MSTTRNEREKDQRDTKETQRESTNPLSTISTIVFQDICTIDDVNPEGKRYDKVDRIKGVCSSTNATVTADVLSSAFPVHKRMQFRLLIIAVNASATELTARECVPSDIWEQSAYLTCGKVYQKEEEEKEGKKHDHDKQDKENMRSLLISCGGLLLHLRGPSSALPSHNQIHVFQKVYCCYDVAYTNGGLSLSA